MLPGNGPPRPRRPTSASNARHTAWSAMRWPSWALAERASMVTASSQQEASGIRRRPGERPRGDVEPGCRLDGAEQVGALAARGQQHQHVPGAPMGADLPGEHLLVSVVVGDGRHRRGLRVQRDGRKRHALAVEPAHQFGRQVLGLGRRAAVPGGEQPLAAEQPAAPVPHPRRRGGRPGCAATPAPAGRCPGATCTASQPIRARAIRAAAPAGPCLRSCAPSAVCPGGQGITAHGWELLLAEGPFGRHSAAPSIRLHPPGVRTVRRSPCR